MWVFKTGIARVDSHTYKLLGQASKQMTFRSSVQSTIPGGLEGSHYRTAAAGLELLLKPQASLGFNGAPAARQGHPGCPCEHLGISKDSGDNCGLTGQAVAVGLVPWTMLQWYTGSCLGTARLVWLSSYGPH